MLRRARPDKDATNAFDKKGFIFAKPPEGVPDPYDRAVDDAIEVDAEEVLPEGDSDTPETLKVWWKFETMKS